MEDTLDEEGGEAEKELVNIHLEDLEIHQMEVYIEWYLATS